MNLFQSFLYLSLILNCLTTSAFAPVPNTGGQCDRQSSLVFAASEPKKEGYKFGDITRSLLKRASHRVNDLTGKDSYEFGDLTKWLHQRAKKRINQVTGEIDYEFGDLTKWALKQVEKNITSYTGKDKYELGDISKEVVRRVKTGEYDAKDIFFALKVLAAAGVSLNPIIKVLPTQGIVGLINVGIANDVKGKVLAMLGNVLDERLRAALSVDQDADLVSAVSRKGLELALSSFTGKSDYDFGDISDKIVALASESEGDRVADIEAALLPFLKEQIAEELGKLDHTFTT